MKPNCLSGTRRSGASFIGERLPSERGRYPIKPSGVTSENRSVGIFPRGTCHGPVREKCEKCARARLAGTESRRGRARFGGRCRRHRRMGLRGLMRTRTRVPRRGASTNARVPTANPRRAVSFFPLARPNSETVADDGIAAPRVPLLAHSPAPAATPRDAD